MNIIFIIYPKLFNCYSKFERKINFLIQQVDNPSLVTYCDYNHLVKKFSENSSISLIEKGIDDFENITHAIVFDDGEEFSEEIAKLKNKKIPLRIVPTKITRVINIKKDEIYKTMPNNEKYEYIGRGSYWGNPYSMYDGGGSRDEVIRKYKYDFDFDKFPNKEKDQIHKLAGKRLGCFCKPQACHGDVLADYLNSYDDGS